jgi:Raf kinase inhibitor-like YbhB/YbcL family protein
LYDCQRKVIYFTIFKENRMFRTLLAIALSSVITLGYAADEVATADEATTSPAHAPKKLKKAKAVKAKPVVAKVKEATKTEAAVFELTSPDIAANSTINKTFEYDGFGCSGENRSPELQWSGAPAGTKSFAVTVYDPDAPTGSGWWHWVVYDLPADTNQLDAGIGTLHSSDLPGDAVQAQNDYGAEAWGGVCPPPGDKAHRYIFTVHALKVEQLDLPDGGTSAAVRYVINANTLATATFTAKYARKN